MYFRTVEISDPRFEHEGVRHMTVKSPALNRRGDLSVYAHPTVETQPCECVLILLNGVYNSHWGWIYHAGVHRTARRLIDSGAIRTMVLAMPSDGLWGDGSAYLEHGREDAERWVMQDVIEACRLAVPRLHPSARLFLAGLSMGGYGALRLGAKWASAVSGISAHSAITHITEMSQFAEEPLIAYTGDSATQQELDPLYWMRRHRDLLPAIRMDCGLNDPLLLGNRKFHETLLQDRIEHTYEEFPGGHNWPYWEMHVEETLLFCEREMRRLGPPTLLCAG